VKKNWNIVLMMAAAVSKNANEATVAPVVETGGVFIWRESAFSRREDEFTFNSVYEEML
jgi:hypothetical protein